VIIGNGLIAKKFIRYKSNPHVLIFASGVSNSKEIDLQKYQREINLLKKIINYMDKNILFIYFSTCSIYDNSEKNTSYVKHKVTIEKIINNNIRNFLIFRISQIVSQSKNQHTLVNFLAEAISKGRHFNLWKNAFRNLIDIDDTYVIIDYIIKNHSFNNQIINIASKKNISVKKIVKLLEKTINKKANYSMVNKGSNYLIPINNITNILEINHINFNKNYNVQLIKKYYSKNKNEN